MDSFEQARQLFLEGLACLGSNDLEGADARFSGSLQLLPDRPSTLTNRAAVRLRLGRLDEAEADARRAVAIDDRYADAWLNLALIALERGDTDAAAGHLQTLTWLDRVDREVFKLLAQELRGGLRPQLDGSLPLTGRLMATFRQAKVQLLLLPLPGRAVPASAPQERRQPKRDRSHTPPQTPLGQRKAARKAAARSSPQQPSEGGKPRQAPASSGPRMPEGLRGKAAADDRGNGICYGFNLGTCKESQVVPGQSCTRGRHACANPGCFGTHPVSKCSR